jgi:hypothetical protein
MRMSGTRASLTCLSISLYVLRDQQQAKRQHPYAQDGQKAEDASENEKYCNGETNCK